MKKLIFFILSLIIPTLLYSQGGEIHVKNNNTNNNKLFLGVNFSPVSSGTKFSSSDFSSKKGLNLQTCVNIGYYFSKTVGISVGLGLSKFSSELAYPSYQKTFDATDSENDDFKMTVDLENYNEKLSASFFDIPITLLLKFGGKTGFFINPGFKIAIGSGAKYSGTGTYSYSGYYEQYNVTLENLESYGFPSDKSETIPETKLDISSSLNLTLASGVSFSLSNKVFLSAGIYYEKGLASIYKGDSDNFVLSKKPGDYNSLLESSNQVSVGAFGVQFGLKYFLK